MRVRVSPRVTDAIGYDAWVLKISADLDPNDGEFMWNTQFGTAAYDIPNAMVIDSSGNVYVAGTTSDDSGILGVSDIPFLSFSL